MSWIQSAKYFQVNEERTEHMLFRMEHSLTTDTIKIY